MSRPVPVPVGQPALGGFDAVDGEVVDCCSGEDDWEKWVAAEPVEANEAAEENRLLARPDDPVLVDETEMRGRCPCCWYGFCLPQ